MNQNKKYIRISSKGLIDTRAFSLMGASPKRNDDTKIGMFGSGLKYSIAFMLRNKIDFIVYSDYRKINFEAKPIDFRGSTFDCIVINGKETDLTTSMGMDWEAWMVVREIYSNSLDEGDSEIMIVKDDNLAPIEDHTVFYIEVTDDLKDVVDNWDLYFSENRKDIVDEVNGCKIFSAISPQLIWYRKGIRCYNYNTDMLPLFHYDLKNVKINEARTASDTWNTEFDIVRLLQESTSVKVVSTILKSVLHSWERDLHWERIYYSDVWCDLLSPFTLVPYENAGHWEAEITLLKNKIVILPMKMIDGLVKRFGEKIKLIGSGSLDASYKPVKQTPKQEFFINKATDFLQTAGYNVKFPIRVVNFVNTNIRGRALNGEILLSERVFEDGIKKIVQVVVEENEHLDGEYRDETREFQDRLFQLLVSAYEDKTGTYL